MGVEWENHWDKEGVGGLNGERGVGVGVLRPKS